MCEWRGTHGCVRAARPAYSSTPTARLVARTEDRVTGRRMLKPHFQCDRAWTEMLAGECSCNTCIPYIPVGQKRREQFSVVVRRVLKRDERLSRVSHRAPSLCRRGWRPAIHIYAGLRFGQRLTGQFIQKSVGVLVVPASRSDPRRSRFPGNRTTSRHTQPGGQISEARFICSRTASSRASDH